VSDGGLVDVRSDAGDSGETSDVATDASDARANDAGAEGGDATDADLDVTDDTAVDYSDAGDASADAGDAVDAVGDVSDTNSADTAPVCTQASDCGSGYACNTQGVCVVADCTLTGAQRPARCDADKATYAAYSPSSAVHQMALAVPTTNCCFDFNGDSINDNQLSVIADDLGVTSTVNQALSDSIAAGDFLLLLEHDDLTSLSNDTFVLNAWLGAYDGITSIDSSGATQNPLMISADSIAQGVFPKHRLRDGEVVSGAFTAEDGSLPLDLSLMGVPLRAPLRDAKIRATIDVSKSGLNDDGVFLTGGEMGGVLTVEETYDGLNEFAKNSCTCMGLGSQSLINYTPGAPMSGTCTSTTGHSCPTGGQCDVIASNCPLLVSFLSSAADIDRDDDGTMDSISAGMTFEASGAHITGVSP
jgi:hypothetical protein